MPRDEHGQEFFPGVYRGVVADVEDLEERGRVRVRIHFIHDDDIPIKHLPWCEALTDEDRAFQVGHRVLLAFEGADRNYPFILGRWFAVPGGLNDLKPERISDYNDNRTRRMIYDDADNLIELNARRRYIRIKSGNQEVRLVQADDSIQIFANGPVAITAKRANINVREFQVDAGDVKISATGLFPEPDPSLAFPVPSTLATGKHEVFANKEVNLYAGSIPGLDPLASIDLGQILDGSGVARQTSLLRMRPSILQLGVAVPTGVFIATLLATLEAATLAKVRSTTKVEIEAPLVEAGLLGGPFDFLVKHTALKAEFDAHFHPDPVSGNTGIPTVPLTTATATLNLKGS